MAKRVSFRVHGTVQGVNFRSFTQRKARSHNLTGWVANTANKTVEGEAQGEDEALQKLFKALSTGPSHARVEKLEQSEVDLKQDETFFEVR